MIIACISHRDYCEIAKIAIATRHATEATGEVLLIRWNRAAESIMQ